MKSLCDSSSGILLRLEGKQRQAKWNSMVSMVKVQ